MRRSISTPWPGGDPLYRLMKRPRSFVCARVGPNTRATGGSRERSSASQVCHLDRGRIEAPGVDSFPRLIRGGRWFSHPCERIWRWNKFGGSFGAAPKRLPSPLAHPKRLPLEPQSVVSGIVMATYIYETVPDSVDIPSRRFEVRQSMLDAPLTHDPETGQPVRRVISGGFGLMTGSKNAPSSGSSSSSCGSGHCGCC
jgi:predicted nucleic acid-binding Zn ribbon protein